MTEIYDLVIIGDASATCETRAAMAELAAGNVMDVLRGKIPPNLVNREVEGTFNKEPLID